MIKSPLSCQNLSFDYPQQRVLDNISIDCFPEQFIGLIGPNGAGKSTLLKLLLGLLEPTSGKVQLNEKPLADFARREIAQHISLVPQDLAIDYAFTVQEIVAMGRNPYLGAYQSESQQDQQIIEQALLRTDLSDLGERKADQLSGGERQRVFIARALAQQASILLLDEPTASLDLCHQFDLMTLIRNLTNENHLSIAAIHDLQLASRFCDRLILLYQGTIVADGSPAEVICEENLYRYFNIEAKITQDASIEGLRIDVLRSTGV